MHLSLQVTVAPSRLQQQRDAANPPVSTKCVAPADVGAVLILFGNNVEKAFHSVACACLCIQGESERFVCGFCALRQNPVGCGHLCMVPLNPRAVLSVVEQCQSLFLFIRSYCMIVSVGIISLQLEVAAGAGCCRWTGYMCRAGGTSQLPGLLSNVMDSTGRGCFPGLFQGLLGSCPPGD